MSYETIEVTEAGHVTHVVLNRPDALNAITPQMHEELQRAFDGHRATLLNEALQSDGRECVLRFGASN